MTNDDLTSAPPSRPSPRPSPRPRAHRPATGEAAGPDRAVGAAAGPAEPDAGSAGGPAAEVAAEDDGGPSRVRILVVGLVSALVLGAAGVAAWVMTGDVPRGTRVLGVPIGAMSRSEAERTLRDRLAPRAAQPVPVRLDGQSFTVDPARIGLELRVDATVGAAMRGPVRITGSYDAAPVVRLDAARLEALLRERLDPARITMVKPSITLRGGAPRVAYGKKGLDLDPGFAAAEVARVWLTGATAEIPLRERAPASSPGQVDELVRTVAEPAVAAPVRVAVAGRTITLPPAALARGLVFRADDAGRLTPAIDAGRLRAAAGEALAAVETAPVPASFVLQGGRPRIRPGRAGSVVDLAALDLLAVLPDRAPRTVTGTLVPADSEVTAAGLAKLGVREKVSTFTTYFPGGRSSPRSQNIITVARAVDGAVVRPGETFSLNGHTGPRDYAAGYRDAPVIVGGKLEPGVGGGASQFTTTLFNAAYYAGLEDVEHKPHSFYFSRYPSVIESTIFYPTLDLKFRNTTPYGILIDTATTGSSVTVTMWSTRYYDSVTTEKSPRRDVTAPPTVHREAGPKCIASSGLPGFAQDAWRIIRKDGREVERKKFTWRYDPEPRFVCGSDGRKQ